MTERKMIVKEQTTLDIDGYLLKDVVTKLTQLLAKYGDTAQISEEQKPYEDGKYLALMLPVPETDGEMCERLNREASYYAVREANERREFERLAAKFAQEPKP